MNTLMILFESWLNWAHPIKTVNYRIPKTKLILSKQNISIEFLLQSTVHHFIDEARCLWCFYCKKLSRRSHLFIYFHRMVTKVYHGKIKTIWDKEKNNRKPLSVVVIHTNKRSRHRRNEIESTNSSEYLFANITLFR